MNRLHPLVEALPPLRRQRKAEAEAEVRAAEMAAKIRAASEEHDAARVAHLRALDAGTAGPPPQFHPPGDVISVQAELARVRDGQRAALAAVADEADPRLREREAELLAAARRILADLRPVHEELQLLLVTARAVSSARGVPGVSSGVGEASLAALVAIVSGGDRHEGSFLPPLPIRLDAELARPASAGRR